MGDKKLTAADIDLGCVAMYAVDVVEPDSLPEWRWYLTDIASLAEVVRILECIKKRLEGISDIMEGTDE